MFLSAPMRNIRFNEMLKYHDGLLAESYMQELGIGYNDALSSIKNDVDDIRQKIKKYGRYELSDIGILTCNEAGKTVMISGNAKFLPDNIGLPSVRLDKLKDKKNINSRQTKTIVLSVPDKLSRGMRYAAMIISVFVISLLLPTTVNEDRFHNTASLSFDSLKNISEQTSVLKKQPAESCPERKEQSATDTDETIVPVNNDCKKEKIQKYHLIIASLPSRESAEKYIKEQKTFTISDLTVIEKDGKFRVSAKGFSTYNAAANYMDSVRNNIASAGKAWIMRNK